MPVREDLTRVMVSFEQEDIDWLDEQAKKLGRSRSWMLVTAVRRWRQKLEKEAERREKARAKRAKDLLTSTK